MPGISRCMYLLRNGHVSILKRQRVKLIHNDVHALHVILVDKDATEHIAIFSGTFQCGFNLIRRAVLPGYSSVKF